MKHILIINPTAGPKNAAERIRKEASLLSEKYDIELYETKAVGDATAFVRSYTDTHPGEALRFYACGGDGTLGEVVTGAYGKENVSISAYPCGSGNDFVKYYGGAAAFLSLEALFTAEEREIDLITDGERYAINVANFGFDYFVCRHMEKLRRRRGFGGKRAYYGGIVHALFTAMKNRASVTVDGTPIGKEKMLLCTVANGSYIGGSFKCAPYTDNEDGLLEVCLVDAVSALKFIRLIGKYKRGEHLEHPATKRIIHYVRAREVSVTSPDERFGYCMDGEQIASQSFTLRILPKAIRFAVPKSEALSIDGTDAVKGMETAST